jgi:hypothetical protein
MARADMMEQLVAARSDVEQACELLVTSSAASLDRCSRVLEAAGQRLRQSQPQLGATGNATTNSGGIRDTTVLAEAYRLQAAVRRAASLLEGASGFHLNWSRLRDAMTGGYTVCGDPAPIPRGSRISIRG